MATNETTTFTDGNIQTGREKKESQQQEMGWQSVTIGGVTGILMGAGAMYAATAFGKEKPADEEIGNGLDAPGKDPIGGPSHVAENGLKVAEVDQNLSFGQAFQTARASVGAGGVFHWHGNIYNTYTETEWNSMSAGERAQFAQQVQPEIRPGEGTTVHRHDYAHVEHKPEEPKKDEPKPDEPKKDDPEPVNPEPTPNDDGEVHLLGLENITIDGQEYVAGHMVNEGSHVYFVDLDNDPEHMIDHAIADRNGDGILTMNEAVEFNEGVSMAEFAVRSLLENTIANASHGQTAQNAQDDIATDMPDYLNDANTVL